MNASMLRLAAPVVASTVVGPLLVAGAIASTLPASAGIEATTEVPEWMTTVCVAEDDVNCYHPDGRFTPDQGVMFVRWFPRSNRVCVIYADHPRRDYCEHRR